MIARTRKTNTRSNQDALPAFVQKKAEIDAMLTRLQALSDEHFGVVPDEVTWSEVGTLPLPRALISREEHEARHVLVACQGQLRLAPSGHVVGFDMDAALRIGGARGCGLEVLSTPARGRDWSGRGTV